MRIRISGLAEPGRLPIVMAGRVPAICASTAGGGWPGHARPRRRGNGPRGQILLHPLRYPDRYWDTSSQAGERSARTIAMTIPPDQAETAHFLSRLAGALPRETHISAVFIGSDTVWKLKKAVRMPFLDFTTVAARRHFLMRELALNEPHA